MSREEYAAAPLDVFVGLRSLRQSEDAERKLSEPKAEPVQVLLAVGQEVLALARLGLHTLSISDGLELDAEGAIDEQEESHGDDVQVEGENLVAQPSHDLRIVHNTLTAFLEHDTALDYELDEHVNKHLGDDAEVAEDASLLVNQPVAQEMEQDGCDVTSLNRLKQVVLAVADEGECSLVLARASIGHIEELVLVHLRDDERRREQRQVQHRMHRCQHVRHNCVFIHFNFIKRPRRRV